MKSSVKCPSCGNTFEADVQVRETNKYGFVVGSKGDVISSLIEKRGKITMIELMNELEKQFPGQNNSARISQVLYQLKKNGFCYSEGTNIFLVTVESAKAKAKEVPKAPKAASPKVQHLTQEKWKS